jgi:hypothetical protein
VTPDPSLVAVLCAGLEALDYRRTAPSPEGDWIRYAKFGRPAYYIMPDASLWWSEIRYTDPRAPETGPFLDLIFDAGFKVSGGRGVRLDADVMLDDLTGGSG